MSAILNQSSGFSEGLDIEGSHGVLARSDGVEEGLGIRGISSILTDVPKLGN